HYVDQLMPPDTSVGHTGDDIRITGAGDHLIETHNAHTVITGAGDDTVVLLPGASADMRIDLGGGTNLVSFAYLSGVRLERDLTTGAYRFEQTSWVLPDGSQPEPGSGSQGWRLQGTIDNVQEVVGSAFGDVMHLRGGVVAADGNEGDDRFTVDGSGVVVDGGHGSDTVDLRGAQDLRVVMDEAGDLVIVRETVQDARIAVGTRAGEPGEAHGVQVQRGTIDARASTGRVVLDVV